MSEKEKNYADLIFLAIVNLEKARTILLTTSENFRLDETNLSKEERADVGLNVEAIGTMLSVADDYIYFTLTALEKGGVSNG